MSHCRPSPGVVARRSRPCARGVSRAGAATQVTVAAAVGMFTMLLVAVLGAVAAAVLVVVGADARPAQVGAADRAGLVAEGNPRQVVVHFSVAWEAPPVIAWHHDVATVELAASSASGSTVDDAALACWLSETTVLSCVATDEDPATDDAHGALHTVMGGTFTVAVRTLPPGWSVVPATVGQFSVGEACAPSSAARSGLRIVPPDGDVDCLHTVLLRSDTAAAPGARATPVGAVDRNALASLALFIFGVLSLAYAARRRPVDRVVQ